MRRNMTTNMNMNKIRSATAAPASTARPAATAQFVSTAEDAEDGDTSTVVNPVALRMVQLEPTSAVAAPALASGLKWHSVGTEKPPGGVKLDTDLYDELACNLTFQTEFTQARWDMYGIGKVPANAFVEVHTVEEGTRYFVPAA